MQNIVLYTRSINLVRIEDLNDFLIGNFQDKTRKIITKIESIGKPFSVITKYVFKDNLKELKDKINKL